MVAAAKPPRPPAGIASDARVRGKRSPQAPPEQLRQGANGTFAAGGGGLDAVQTRSRELTELARNRVVDCRCYAAVTPMARLFHTYPQRALRPIPGDASARAREGDFFCCSSSGARSARKMRPHRVLPSLNQ